MLVVGPDGMELFDLNEAEEEGMENTQGVD
jgi:hypothetical protein